MSPRLRSLWKWLLLCVALSAMAGLTFSGCQSNPAGPCGECPAGQTCNKTTKKCVKKTKACIPCTSSVECDNAETCVDGCCQSGKLPGELASDASTPDPGTSENSPTGCNSDADCSGETTKCLVTENRCVACLKDEDCGSAARICTNNECKAVDLCKNVQCEKDKSCNPRTGKCVWGTSCPDVPCPVGECCNNDDKCSPCGKKAFCDECKDHAECGDGNKCILMGSKKVCSKACPDDKCPDGFRCFDYGSAYGKQCVSASGCKPPTNQCQGVQCPSGQKCCPAVGSCGLCCEDNDCSFDETCKPDINNQLKCQKKSASGCSNCKSNEVCDTSQNKCVPDCRKGSCPSGQVCSVVTGLCNPKDCRSNFTCPVGQVCDNVTGKCKTGSSTKDCRKAGQACTKPFCCNRLTGKCETHCRSCGCTSGKTCNQTTGICQTSTTCQVKKSCSGRSDCCGRSCELIVVPPGRYCSCKRDSDCGRYRCTGLLIKHCR